MVNQYLCMSEGMFSHVVFHMHLQLSYEFLVYSENLYTVKFNVLIF